MNILFLISQLPYPADTGAKIRSFNLIKSLSKEHFITLVTFGNSGKENEKIKILKEFCKRVEIVPKKRNNIYFAAFKNLFSGKPFSVDKYYSKELSKRIADLLEKENFDLLHCDSVQMSLNVLDFNNIPRVLTQHNIESQIIKRLAENEPNILKRRYFYLQHLRLQKYEIFACGQFCNVITVSQEDKKFLSKFIPGEQISVVPNGVDCSYFTPSEDGIRPYNLVFTGSMDWLPNEDAMVYFIKCIFPLVKEKKPETKLTIVGRSPSNRLQQLAFKDNSIELTGEVIDVRPYIKNSCVFVVPLRIGGGTRLKILEALAMGKPVVSTSIGCEGLEVTDKRDIVVADSPGEFAGWVLALFNNGKITKELGKAGRELTEHRYDWKIVSNQLDNIWKNAADKVKFPALLYHDICDDNFDIGKARAGQRPYILNESEFERQMGYLHEYGKKRVIICFDDGLESNYKRALPILKKYSLKAIFFITAGNVGRTGMMNWEQIRHLQDAGMEIGSHGLTHSNPANLSYRELEHELKESRKILEEKLKIHIDYFSSPTGFYNPLLPEIAKNAGYKAVFISRAALNIENSFVLFKTSIKRDYSFEKFVSIVKQDAFTFKHLYTQQKIRNRLKGALGPKAYNFLRSAVLTGTK